MVYDSSAGTADLEKLAAELGARGFTTQLHAPAGRVPSLAVTNPRAAKLTETIMTGDGSFWWSWAERIARLDSVAAAADAIARVLASRDSAT